MKKFLTEQGVQPKLPKSHKPANPEFTQVFPVEHFVPRSAGNGHCPKSPTGGHYWVIESSHLSDSKQSSGVCRYCRAAKKYWNAYEDAMKAGSVKRRKSDMEQPEHPGQLEQEATE
jgi:hypothetical protein